MDAIALKRLDEKAQLPTRATDGSFGYDLATVERATVGARETKILP